MNPSIVISPARMADFCRTHRIRRLALFGSALRSDFAPDSDVDVLVEFEPDARIGLRFFAIERELSELFGRTVDLCTPKFLSPDFRDEVLAEAETQYDATR
ncbi:MAG: nucleotidyltransferase family protein [Planctomycetia bacterium]|nr:nucleotidyltransferase family protein [Planctomycetia bacterium]